MKINVNADSYENGAQVSVNDKVASTIKHALASSGGLSQGQVFRGNIQDIIGNSVKLSLGDGQLLSATLENGVNFNIGDNVSFLVKSNDGSRILLQSVNTSEQPQLTQSLLSSLEQLGLTINERNMNMVREMMSYNMKIDADTLGRMERLINSYPGTDAAAIVEMSSHNIPVTEENIGQFEAYKSYRHSMAEGIGKMTEALEKLVQDNPKLGNDILNMLNEIKSQLSGSNVSYQTVQSEQSAAGTVTGQAVPSDTEPQILQTGQGVQQEQPSQPEQITAGTVTGQAVPPETEAQTLQTGQGVQPEQPSRQEQITAGTVTGQAEQKAQTSQNIQQSQEMQTSQMTEETEKSLRTAVKEAAESIKSRWMADTAELEGKSGTEIKDIIRRSYEALAKSTEHILETLKNNKLENTDAYRAAENVKNNMQFMNDMNHMASYIQVPFRTQQGEANGELYVYNKNKNKTLEDGILTAFLHLDMEHLGATDVSVTMEASDTNVYAFPKVTTRFTLTDAVSQDIVEENLPKLKARLEKLGYSAELTSEVVTGQQSTFERILEADRPRHEVKRYGFDIRL